MLNDDQYPEEAEQRARNIRNVRYAVEVRVSDVPTDESFPCTTTILFSSASASTWIDCDAESVQSVMLNGRPISPDAVRDGRIMCEECSLGENTLEIQARFRYSRAGIGLHRTIDTDGRMYMYTNSEPFDAHRWFPCFDQPDIKGRFSLRLTAPKSWVALSNFPAISSRSSSGMMTTIFEETIPISTYLMAWCTGPFVSHNRVTASGIPLGVYVRATLEQFLDADFIFELTEKGLTYYTELFGRPLPCPKYDQVLCPEFNSGAMENLGCVTFRDELCVFKGKKTAAQKDMMMEFILHEMAHMWFGDEVTLRQWKDLWLNESSADLFEKLSQDAISPESHVWATFANGRKSWGMADDQLPSSHPIADSPKPVSRALDNFDGISYAKGGASLRQLIAYIGLPAFVKGLRAYFERYARSNASLEDYLQEMEHASGISLNEWAQVWLKTRGMNRITGGAIVHHDRMTSFSLCQSHGTGDEVLRPHVIRVGAYVLNAEGRLERVHQEECTLSVISPTTGMPGFKDLSIPDVLLVNDDDLTYAKIRLDPRSLTAVLHHLSAFDDPLARATCWGILWDMVRDGELSTGEYLECIATHAPLETVMTVLEGERGLLGKAQTALIRYGSDAKRFSYRQQLTSVARRMMREALPGSDTQYLWARSFIRLAGEPDEMELLLHILDGSLEVQGLKVDQVLRWEIVFALAAHNMLDAELLDEEGHRDPTDQGQRNMLAAKALRPTGEAKEEAWIAATQMSDASLYERAAHLAGFQRWDQEELLAPYVSKYCTFVQDLWQGEWSAVEARELTRLAFPVHIIRTDVVAVIEDLAGGNLPDAAQRILLDSIDEMKRTLRARERDEVRHEV